MCWLTSHQGCWLDVVECSLFPFLQFSINVDQIFIASNCAYIPTFSMVEEDELQPLNEQHKSIRRSSSSKKSKEDVEKEGVASVGYHKLVSW